MNKVITVNLNGNAYQIDEDGYNALRDYINRAEAQLHASADKREVIADLEQSIADKCVILLRPHKNVITAAEIAQILTEIGPVQTADGQPIEAAPLQSESPPPNRAETHTESSRRPRRLYRLREGAKWAGVCAGLAAFADIEITNVRAIFILATFASGLGLLVYVALMFILPVAYTEDEVASAYARPPELRHT